MEWWHNRTMFTVVRLFYFFAFLSLIFSIFFLMLLLFVFCCCWLCRQCRNSFAFGSCTWSRCEHILLQLPKRITQTEHCVAPRGDPQATYYRIYMPKTLADTEQSYLFLLSERTTTREKKAMRRRKKVSLKLIFFGLGDSNVMLLRCNAPIALPCELWRCCLIFFSSIRSSSFGWIFRVILLVWCVCVCL